MRILHTSDIHLSPDRPHTFEALGCILEKCETHSVDLLTIGGDMFDRPRDVETLRPKLRKTFSDRNFDIVSIPGNHDISAYNRELNFGERFKMMTDEPYEVRAYEEVNLIGVPFTETLNDEDYLNLRGAIDPNKINVLLMHCTLDIGYGSGDFGDEETIKYCSVTSAVLSSLGYDLILGGHFHTDYIVKPLGGNIKFVYPGSPVSLSWKEIGQRQVALIDTESLQVNPIFLESFFYDAEKFRIFPGIETSSLKEIEDWVKSYDGKSCELAIQVDGFGTMDETQFAKEVNDIGSGVKVENNYRNVEHVLSHTLYKRFYEKLVKENDSLDKDYLQKMVIEVLTEMLAERKIV